MSQAPDNRTSAPRARRWPWIVLGFALLAGACVAAIGWVVSTTAGISLVIAVINRAAPVQIVAQAPRGSLRAGFGFDRLTIRVRDTEVRIDALDAVLNDYALRPLRFDFARLDAARVYVRVTPSGEPSTGPPASIASPVAVGTQSLRVGEFLLRVGADQRATDLAARAIDGRVALGPFGYRIETGAFEFGPADAPLAATVRGELGGARPFALRAQGDIASTWQNQPVRAALEASGSLVDMNVNARVSGGQAAGSVSIGVASFGAPALTRLRADLSGIDPRAWYAAAPSGDLRVRADLAPTAAAAFTLAGDAQIDNAAPGPIDGQRLPARRARARVTLNQQLLRADDLALDLTRGAARGWFQLTPGATPSWATDLRLQDVDPASLHSRLRPLRVDGTVKAASASMTPPNAAAPKRTPSDVTVQASLTHRAVAGDKLRAALEFALRANAERVLLERAQLALGDGRLQAQGEISLTGTQRVQLQGSAEQLDPSLLVQGFDAKLTGDLQLDGALAPAPVGKLHFAVRDSSAFGRPLSGNAIASLAADRQLDVDLDFAVRSARLTARGGLGSAERTLRVELQAPALEELGLPLRGALQAQATLRGDWQAPAVDAQVAGNALRYGAHRLERLHALVTYGGGADGALSLRADLAAHRLANNPVASISAATLTIDGRPSAHTLRFEATNEEAQPLKLAASGGWSKSAWRGQLTEATAGRPFDLTLGAPTELALDGDGLQFGPAQLALAGARIDRLLVRLDDQALETSGSFDAVDPAALLARSFDVQTLSVKAAQPRTPLTLRGEWELKLGATADGRLVIERAAGDIYAGTRDESAIGLRELRLEAQLRANQLQATARMEGERAGTAHGRLEARVEKSADAGWRLAQNRPWHLEAEAQLPSINWMNALLSDRVRANLRLGGSLEGKVRVNGTPAQPVADGTLTGEQLRVAWIEQGVRMANGVLRARIEGNVLLLEELRFAGPPRVQPSDKRVAAAAANQEPGYIAATGRLQLPELSGYVQVQAERLPLLQRRDRWVIASGGANVELAPRRVQVNGAVAAVAGFVDVARRELPSLSSDVVVVETTEARKPPEPQVQFGFDLGIDAGPAFYLTGSGIDTRIEGAIRVRNEGRGNIRATGALSAADGTYEGYGQKLKIERGRVNFQGPIENPGLDILALRTGLPDEAGDIGVSITRTAANPLVRLYSNPTLPDYQALSWLVLGRPAEQSGTDNVALARAAVGLLSGSGEGLPSTLARQLGIDEISLRTGQLGTGSTLLPRQSVAGNLRGDTVGTATASGEIISIGKRLNETLTLSYEQALYGTGNVVKLSYQLSRRLSLIASAGTDNALDLVYSISFD
jgi:translocation and assembly module TamB